MKQMPLLRDEEAERKKEIFKAPRGTTGAEPGTLSWCYQTVSLLGMYWQSKNLSEKSWLKILGDLKAYKVWEKIPPDNPYGSLDELLKVEVGVDERIINMGQPLSLLTKSYNELRNAAVTFFGDLGAWAYDEWTKLNDRYFGSQNEPGPILWGLTAHGRSLGSFAANRNAITLHKSLVQPSTDAPWDISWLGKRFASDVLLHEMIHQHIHQMSLPTKGYSSHDNKSWCDELNRLGPMMGFKDMPKADVIKQKRVGGKVTWYVPPGCMTRKELSEFPHSQRTYEYFEEGPHTQNG
jgi:hypothetical protein